ncbi:MAG: ATP-dependent RecD-like DNA helicase, partial [Planctomycetes bacterium]|nr:ATP-dependent RecD-like DNA helicase [Planctomycetota bacterium]
MNSSPVPEQHDETVSGLIERVTFHSDESGFTVIKIKAKGFRDLLTVVGSMPAVTAGEWVEASGKWAFDKEHGRQLRAEWMRTARPDTLEGIERYLGSGLIKGIGPHYAAKMVARFGKDIFEIIETESERLTFIKGLGEKRRKLITIAWAEQKVIREIMVFLHSHGVGTSRAFRIYKTYGNEAIAKVTENPYRLAQDIWGIGFRTADQVACSLGIPHDSDIRARAGVEYVLTKLTDDGHTAYPRDELIQEAIKVLDIDQAVIDKAVEYGVSARNLVLKRGGGGELVYLASLAASEEGLATGLITLTKGRHPCPPIDFDKALTWVEEKIRLTLAESQRQAITQALQSKVFVLTGGPGTGKTTIVNAMVKIAAAKKLSVILCAPTGRAAKRLTETSGREAKTIHRLLEFDPKNGGFKRSRDHPLRGDVFVVDEASMLDVVLAQLLVQAIPREAALILVGDVDQLPSVGPGTVLLDVIASGGFPVCRLTEIFRQASRSRIVINAHRVNNGQLPEYPRAKVKDSSQCDFYFIEADQPEEAEAKVVQLLSGRLQRGFDLDPVREVQVLTPMQRGILGARNLNQVIQATLNPSAKGIQRYGLTFRAGDKVMQIQNNYDKEVFNGDIGRIVRLDDEEREVVIDFDGREVVYQY